MIPSFQNLDIKTIIILGIVFGIIGFFVWNKFLNKKQAPPPPQPSMIVQDEASDNNNQQQQQGPKVLSV